MASSKQKLEWCVVRLGDDKNWWVEEISDPIRWDVDGLSIIDPRQMSYVIEQCDVLREYGFDPDIIEQAFFPFAIESEEKKGRIRLRRTRESLLEADATLFAIPDVIDEEKGPYADFLNEITRARVRLINDLIDFEQNLTVDELEEEIRERQNSDFMEGKAVHFFAEMTAILEYLPEGFEIEDEEDPKNGDEEIVDIPDFEDVPDEKIEEDDTMKWDEEEKEEEEYDDDERPDDFDEVEGEDDASDEKKKK